MATADCDSDNMYDDTIDSEEDNIVDIENQDEFKIDNEPQSEDLPRKIIYGRNGTKWFTKPCVFAQSRSFAQKPGPRDEAMDKHTEKDIWMLFFPEGVMSKIVQHTNAEIRQQQTKGDDENVMFTDKSELYALFGLLYFAGLLKDAHLTLDDLWSEALGPAIFRNTMSRLRFAFLMNCLKFEDRRVRSRQKINHDFAPVRAVWGAFNELCAKLYAPSREVTIGEQLINFPGYCPFKMYSASDPTKCGINLILMCDARTSYICSARPCFEKETLSARTDSVLELTKSIHDTNRNVTVDNWFQSCDLADKLFERNVTVVGAMRKDQPDIPSFLTSKKPAYSSTTLYQKNKILACFAPKDSTRIVLLSSLQMPDIFDFYNSTKKGVLRFNQLCRSATVSRKTRSWPLRVFFGILDSAAINSFIIFQHNNPQLQNVKRSKFLKDLAWSLCVEQMHRRLENDHLSRHLKENIAHCLGIQSLKTEDKNHKRCGLGPRVSDRKGTLMCLLCKKNVCGEHKRVICQVCFQPDT